MDETVIGFDAEWTKRVGLVENVDCSARCRSCS